MKKTIKITTSLLLSFACVFSMGDFAKPHIVKAETVYSLTNPTPINEIFADPNLAQVVADWLKLPSATSTVTQSQLNTVKSLHFSSKGVQSLEGVEYLKNLTQVFGNGNQVSDLGPLSNLTQLEVIQMPKNQISDLTPIANLTTLMALDFEFNNLQTIEPLKNLTNMLELNVSANPVSDISAVKNMTQLEFLTIRDCEISDLSPVENLSNMLMFWAGGNNISDITPLKNMSDLLGLSLFGNQIKDVSVVKHLTSLEDFDVKANQVSDISGLATVTTLETVTLSFNRIIDISPLKNLTNLTRLELENQTRVLDAVEVDDPLILPAPVIDKNGSRVAPTKVNHAGVYADGEITWEGLQSNYILNYEYDLPVTIGSLTTTYSGKITQSLLEKPIEPVNPVDPVDPADPADPANPVDPTKPVEPNVPDSPGNQTPPLNQAISVNEEVAIQPIKGTVKLPKTGDSGMTSSLFGGLTLAAIGVILLRKIK
ncbi:internalin N-terminal domain-containing protein [Listeria marthii]|uniref:leucine-rich repeat domain-containing protein n=1 Tax=Listeria marthii TaxID=529731 RepID=UPI0018880456|nr:leucine-rich repeat domain-containing protein [Listeria marthii]MBF2673749.1 internalin N-terminal domain-containing protein [Listeria marthii]